MARKQPKLASREITAHDLWGMVAGPIFLASPKGQAGEIEITPAMIQAGVKALDWAAGAYEEAGTVALVYKAMRILEPQKTGDAQPAASHAAKSA